jgi:hypothetical protein
MAAAWTSGLRGVCLQVSQAIQWYCCILIHFEGADVSSAVKCLCKAWQQQGLHWLCCAAAELLLRRPWLPGNTDIEQLTKIFAALGTPTKDAWPDATALPNFVEFTAVPAPPLRQQFTQVSHVQAACAGASCSTQLHSRTAWWSTQRDWVASGACATQCCRSPR